MNEEREKATKREKMRARKIDNKLKLVIVLTIISIVAVFCLIMAFNTYGKKGESGAATADSFPHSVETLYGTNFLYATRNDIIVLNGNLLEFVSAANGKSVKSVTHFFSNPIVDVNDKYVLTYDQGRKNYRIDTSGNVICETEAKDVITSACIGNNGSYAIATQSGAGKSDVTVYSKNLKEIFTWKSPFGYIIEMSLSYDGENLAVVSLNSSQTQIKSTVNVFNLNNGEAIAELPFEGLLISELKYVNNSDFYALSEQSCSFVEKGKTNIELLKPGEQTISKYSFSSNGNLSLISSKYNSDTTYKFIAYGASGNELFVNELSDSVKDIHTSNSTFSVLYNEGVDSYDKKGKCTSSAKVGPFCSDFVQLASRVYLLDVDKIIDERLEVAK